MEENFKVGTEVFWKSQGNGKTTHKSGHIKFIVPENTRAIRVLKGHEILSYVLKFDGGPRKHKSYLVEVKEEKRKPKLYWPLIKNLKTIL